MKTKQLQIFTLLTTSILLTACVTTGSNTTNVANANANQSVSVPPSFVFNETQYTLINSNEQDAADSKVYTYQYTTNGQTINNWQSIISIAHNTKDSKPEDVLQIMADSLENTTPKPIYDIKYNQDYNTALAQIIYLPQENYPAYESSTWILDFNLNCSGYTSTQFAVRLPADTPRENVIQTNNTLTDYMVNNLPKMQCVE